MTCGYSAARGSLELGGVKMIAGVFRMRLKDV